MSRGIGYTDSMRWVVAIALLLAAARPAAARPKIPKALEGVEFREGSREIVGTEVREELELIALRR